MLSVASIVSDSHAGHPTSREGLRTTPNDAPIALELLHGESVADDFGQRRVVPVQVTSTARTLLFAKCGSVSRVITRGSEG
jgi:hypothetical protein